MKNVVRKIVIITICVLGIYMFSNMAMAANTTDNTANAEENTSNSSNTSSTESTNEKPEESNANLSNLGIRPHDFSGFRYGTTTYDVTVPADVEEIEVYATAQAKSAKVSGTGTKTLKDGLNSFDIVVTAEDGTTKTYTINVTREEEQQNTENTENTENVQDRYSGDGLASLKIADLELTPEFDTNIYEYKVKYIGEETKLDIKAEGTDPYYEIDITGNEDLKEGENIITILVSDPDGNNVATYQITVNKSLVDEEAIAREQEEARKKEEQKKMILIGGIVAVVIIAIIIFLIVRHKRNKAWAEEYTVPYSGLNDNNENGYYGDDYEDEMDYEESEENKISKEKAREKFLNNYNSENLKDYEEIEDTPRRRHKGKRFK